MSTIVVYPARVAKALALVTAGVVGAAVFVLVVQTATGSDYMHGLAPLFRLNGEMNIPTFYSACLLLLNAGISALVAQAARWSLGVRTAWGALAGVFIYLSYDELFSVHERLGPLIRGWLDLSGVWYFAWFVGYGAGALLVAIAFIPAWRVLPARYRKWLVVGALVYLGGAVGIEMLESARFAATGTETDLTYVIMTVVEEAMEMAGLVVCAYALMRVLGLDGDFSLTVRA